MRNKKIIITALCIAICIMAIGFAAFSTQLTINGTANISSTWKVVFSNIEEVSKTSGVKINNAAQASGTTATFDVGLTSPGDKIVYKITVANQGTLDAIVNGITISDTGSDAIIFEVDGINKGDELAKQSTTTFNVTIKYDESITGQPSKLDNTLTVNINYIQDLGQTPAGSNPNIVADSFAAKILSDNNEQSDLGIDFSSSTSGYSGLYYTNTRTEDNKTTYYFRGIVENNYVKFGKDITTNKDIIWRIVRINEDGSVRLVTENSVGSSVFNEFDGLGNVPDYSVGYMHSAEDIYTNEKDSVIKDYLDDWYINKTNLNSYANLMSNSAGFCNDRTFSSTSRINNLNQPQFACPEEERDLFTLGTSSLGNKKLTHPVGLLTVDEVIYAGGVLNTGFKYSGVNDFYLIHLGNDYWHTMTSDYDGLVHFVEGSMGISASSDPVDMEKGVRPVINVNFTSSNILGNGSSGTPYVIG